MACEGNTSYRRLACERRSSSGGNGTELLPGARGDARCRAVGRDGWRQPHTRQGAGQHLVANALAAKGCVGAWSRMGQNGMSVRVDVYVFAGERVRPGDAACEVFPFFVGYHPLRDRAHAAGAARAAANSSPPPGPARPSAPRAGKTVGEVRLGVYHTGATHTEPQDKTLSQRGCHTS